MGGEEMSANKDGSRPTADELIDELVRLGRNAGQQMGIVNSDGQILKRWRKSLPPTLKAGIKKAKCGLLSAKKQR
jgi:hypothetical protein